MDPFSISAGAAGFLSLAIEITKILKAYVDGVRSAPEEARNLLAEVTALCEVLKPFLQFLKEDYKGNFAATSALVLAIDAYKDQITKLYKKIEKINVNCEEGQIAQIIERFKWPLQKEDYERTMATIQRFTQTFQFSLTVENCKLLAKTYEEVLAEFKVKEKQMEQTLESFRTMKLPGIEALLTASKEQSIILGEVSKTIELGQETQKKILSVARNTNRIANDQEMESLLQWISPLEPQTRHQDVRSKRLANIGNWFLESEKFQNWRDDSDGVNIFGCYGIPGAGKTFITSLVIDHLGGFAGGKICIAFIYCDYNEAKEQTPVNMIGGLLKQAITASKTVSTGIIDSLLEKKKGRKTIEVKDAVHSLSLLLQSFDKTYICIDALDECNETDRRQLIQYLVELSSSSDGTDHRPIRLFFTGRPPMKEYVISHASVAPKVPLMVKLEASDKDITAYIAQKINDDKRVKMDENFKKQIIEEIVSASKGMFLLPALQIETVLDEPTIRKRREALKCMPRELYDAFGITLDRIRAQKKSMSSLAMKVLKWIFLSARPLSLEELRYALAIEPDDTELHRDNFVEPQFILDCCLGLVIVDESTSTARLVHKSLQDYFQDQYDEGSLFNEGHMEIASVCMTYMSFHHLSEELPVIGSEIADRYPLLGYAAVRWDYHLRSSKTRNPHVEDMAFNLVTEKYTSQLAAKTFLTSRIDDFSCYAMQSEDTFWDSLEYQSIPPGLSTKTFPLYIAASTGSPELFCRVFDRVSGDINEREAWGNYVLILAAKLGHVSVIEIILKPPYKAYVNVEAKYGQTALLLAAGNEHTEVVKLLLQTDGIDVNTANLFGNTPLVSAALKGHYEVVKLLLGKNGVDVNKADSCGYTPLVFAAGDGHTEIVKLLLETDGVEVNKANEAGDTPLMIAAANGHAEVVKFLLEKNGVDVNTTHSFGYTPLVFAAGDGHTEIVRLLLEHGAAVDTRNENGRTAISIAAQRHRLETLNVLLQHSTDVNTTDGIYGRTPLIWSFYHPRAGEQRKDYHSCDILKTLLSQQSIDVNWSANDGSTALSRAIECELHDAEELLRAHGAV